MSPGQAPLSDPAASDRILILDFGSQVTQLIARRVREHHVYSEIHAADWSAEEVRSWKPAGIILSGGPSSVLDDGAPVCDPAILELGIPVLGICYGLQLLVQQLGGRVEPAEDREFGRASLVLDRPDRVVGALFSDAGGGTPGAASQVWMSHGDSVLALPPGFEVVAHSDSSPYAAIRHEELPIWGVQFHPEVAHTTNGEKLLDAFVRGVCGCAESWTMDAFIENSIERIRSQVGRGEVVCGLSGGVDSSVAAALVHRAIGDQLTCIFVDTGLLRENEREDVEALFRKSLGAKQITVDASKRFLDALAGVADPEQKRRIIGHHFIEVFEEESAKLGEVDFLVQGTLYPDVIESESVKGPSATIKTHHNVGGLPEDLRFSLIEPLRELFKDEVREVGRRLGLPEEAVGRHPFPGPGLAIRVLGEVSEASLAPLRRADAIAIEEIRKAGLYDEIWQALVVLLPIRSVGVMGDARTYENVAALRCVSSTDAMTADFSHIPFEVLATISSRIINEVSGINRVVYDISSKPPATIEWE